MIRDCHAIPTQLLASAINLDATESALLALMRSDSYNTPARNVWPGPPLT